MSLFLTVLSQIVGWIYFAAWSVSFYPQILLNYQLKHVSGYSLDFGVLNFSGFLAYSLYSIWGYIEPGIMPGQVDWSDIAFACHAWLITTITLIQCNYYDSVWNRTALWVKLLTLFFWVSGAIYGILQLTGNMITAKDWNGCLYLGYIKVFITLIKYLPQVYMNYSRKSTIGWSIMNVLLDFTGGSLSILQIFIDGANTGDWNVFGNGGAFNVAKFCLGFLSMSFDVIFMIQHYVLYRENNNKGVVKGVDLDPLYKNRHD
ncbi:unnamed protein product [Blepharisma stoltei]|uniref:Cystinosin n=1 Tax=Blepharisma stoltei TaxID=1481888 RepID=A0AAU9JX34_9CILI|nr:unnamed protein product [Blepharisma stoltei]